MDMQKKEEKKESEGVEHTGPLMIGLNDSR